MTWLVGRFGYVAVRRALVVGIFLAMCLLLGTLLRE